MRVEAAEINPKVGCRNCLIGDDLTLDGERRGEQSVKAG